MKNLFKFLIIAGALIGCLSPNIELKPVKKTTDCLIREISTVKGVKSNIVIETQEFTYNSNGNPIKWIIKNQNNVILMEFRMFYENNRLIRVEKDSSITATNWRLASFVGSESYNKHSIKYFKINADFSEIIVDRLTWKYFIPDNKPTAIPSQLNAENQQKLKFSRNKENELKIDCTYVLQNSKIKDFWVHKYDDSLKSNVVSKQIRGFASFPEILIGFWRNVKNPFSANIYLSLIANYDNYSGYKLEGGNWNKNMESIDPLKNFITTYETNEEGFPCRLTTKNPDFSPYPLEVRYYYNNCDCK